TINAASPFGVRRGDLTTVTFDGANLKGSPELVAPFRATLTPPSAPNTDAGHWKATLVVDPETAVGVYPIRVRTEDGISNPLLFAVGKLPQVAEAEDNSSFESAQPI